MSDEDCKERHPSYGIVSINHIMCGPLGANLFMSPTRAHGLVALTISHAHLSKGDILKCRPWPEKQIVEIWLSPVQFAELLTTLNRGDGVPCTIHELGIETVEEPPVQQDDIDEAASRAANQAPMESAEILDELIAQVEGLIADNKPLGIKALRELARDLGTARMRVGSDVKYWRKELSERAHGMRTKIKADMHATAELIIRAMGMEALAEKARGMLPSYDPPAQAAIDVEVCTGSMDDMGQRCPSRSPCKAHGCSTDDCNC